MSVAADVLLHPAFGPHWPPLPAATDVAAALAPAFEAEAVR